MGGERYTLVVLLGLAMALAMTSVSAYTANSDGISFNCTSCADCTNAINDGSRSIVYLTANITNHASFCINDPAGFNNITFDCMGNVMNGDATYDLDDVAIFSIGKASNTIQNCIFTDWAASNYMVAGINNTITQNTYINNGVSMAFQWGSSNNLTSNTNINNSFAAFFQNSNNNLIAGNNMTNCTRPFFGGIIPSGCISLNMSNNTLVEDNLVVEGVVVDFVSQNNTFLRNELYNSTQGGLIAFGSMYLTIRSNIMRNASQFCMASFLSSNVTWTENNISNCTAAWAALGGANYSIRDNNITNSTIGITSSGVNGPIRIWGNYLADCETGMEINGAAAAGLTFLVVTNEIYRTTIGILLDSSDNVGVYNNTIWHGADGEGIFLDDSNWNNIVYNDIRFKNTSILVNNGDSNTILANFLSDDTNGLKLMSGSDYNNIMSNFITRNSEFGLYVPEPGAVGAGTPGARENQIINNTLNDTEVYYGIIWMATYVPNNFTDNIFIYPDDNAIVAFDRIYLTNIYGEYEADYTWALDEVKPDVAVAFAKTGAYLSMLAPPVRGMYYIRMNLTDSYNNTYSRRVYYFADVNVRQRLRYYMRGPDPTHGQGIVGPNDVGTLNTVPPTVNESTDCQFGFVLALDNISNITISALPFYYRSAAEPSVIMLQYLNNSFRYEVNRPATSWDWQSAGMLRDLVEVGNILALKYEFNATKINNRYNNTFAPQWVFPAVADLYNVTLKFGRGDWTYDTFPAMNTTPGNMSWSDMVFQSYSAAFPRIIGVNGTDTDILSFTGTDRSMLMQVEGNETTNITVNMTEDRRYFVRYDGVCDSPDCPYVVVDGIVELYPTLGSEHEIVINTVPCEEEEEEEDRGETRGFVLVAPEYECITDADCRANEYCDNGDCRPVLCPCGNITSHICIPFECCSDEDCEEGERCIDYLCVVPEPEEAAQEAEAGEPAPPPPKPTAQSPAEAQEPPADWTWLWVLIVAVIVASGLILANMKRGSKKGSKKGSLRSL